MKIIYERDEDNVGKWEEVPFAEGAAIDIPRVIDPRSKEDFWFDGEAFYITAESYRTTWRWRLVDE